MSETNSTASTVGQPGGLFARMRPLILFGLGVAAVRFALDCARLEQAMWFGVYFLMPVALLVAGVRGTYDDLRWRRLALGMLLLAVFCWTLPNAVTYPTAQFMGWQHGRFASPDRGPPIADTAAMKLVTGLTVAALTTIAGSVWLLFFGTVLVWLPGRVRARKKAASGA